MEMERVPQAGYAIKALPICGFDRRRVWRNVGVLWRVMKSKRLARRIVREFSPAVVVGVGGYASGPTLQVAQEMGIPTLIQEQNSYAGVTNRLLAGRAARICVAYEGMERFFPKGKMVVTGNPVRSSLLGGAKGKEEALASFGLHAGRKTALVIGGSLGARTLNMALHKCLPWIGSRKVQFIWQTGSVYYDAVQAAVKRVGKPANLFVTDFITRMGDAYAAADLVVSRAGASSISELCLLGKAAILVPSPNVAEDHQTKNAMALVDKQAALMVRDAEAEEKLVATTLHTLDDDELLESLGTNIRKLAFPDAAERIADEVFRLAAEAKGGKRKTHGTE